MSESNSLDQSVASVNSKDASNTAISTSKDATNNTKTVARFTVEPGLADYGAVEGEKIEGISTNVEGDAALAWEEEEVDDDVHTALINEMCGSENQMAPTLRVVLDSHQDGEFVDSLRLYIKKMDLYIERICHHHYAEFVDSVREMLQVRRESFQFKEDILGCGHELLHTGRRVQEGYGELVQLRVVQRNIAQSIEALNACLPVLNTYTKVTNHVDKKDYYKALKALEHLELTLPKLEGLSIAMLLSDSIPRVRGLIKQEVRSDLQDWLESVLTNASHLGAAMMFETARETASQSDDLEARLELFSLPQGEGQEDGPNIAISAAVIDYQPMYRCLHIYSVLGVSGEFESFYIDSRKKQAVLVLEGSGQTLGMGGDSFKRIRNYFCQVLGFFIVEDVVMNTTAGLVSASNIDDLWKMGLDRIGTTLRKELMVCEDKAVLMQLKQFVAVFCLTLGSYGYNVAQLYDLLLSVRDRYDQLLMNEWEAAFDQILEEDDLKHVSVDTQEEWDLMIEELGPKAINAALMSHGKEFPRTLAFSSAVIGIYSCVEDFYKASLSFLLDLNLSHTQLDEMIRVSGSRLISERLSKCIIRTIDKQTSCININGLMQCVSNCQLLPLILANLDTAIAKLTNTTTNRSFSSADYDHNTNQSEAVLLALKKSSNVAVEGISHILVTLINAKFDTANYAWETQSPSDVPSPYLESLVQDLSPILASEGLSTEVIRTCSFAATTHAAGRFSSLITGLDYEPQKNQLQGRITRLKPLKFKIFKTLELDVQLLRGFAASTEVPLLAEVYDEVSQLIDLFRTAALDDYLKPDTRRAKHGRLQKHVVIAVVERMLATPQGQIQKVFGPNEAKKKNLFLYLGELKGLKI